MLETMDIAQVKAAKTQFNVASFITDRFSPRAFADKPISDEAMNILFEAASWAPSSMNEQPWAYYYAHKGTESFDKISACLMPFNEAWAKNAAVLVVTVARKTFAGNGKPNGSAEHDLGMANATLCLQAAALDILGHAMGGFSTPKTIETLGLDDNLKPVCIIAFGYLGDIEQLDEPLKSRELVPRTRKPLDEFVKAI